MATLPAGATLALGVLLLAAAASATPRSKQQVIYSTDARRDSANTQQLFPNDGVEQFIRQHSRAADSIAPKTKTEYTGLRDGVYYQGGNSYAPYSPYYSSYSYIQKNKAVIKHVVHYPDGSVYELTSDGQLKPIGGPSGSQAQGFRPPERPLVQGHRPQTTVVIKVPFPSPQGVTGHYQYPPPRPVYVPQPRPDQYPRPQHGGPAPEQWQTRPQNGGSAPEPWQQRPQPENWGPPQQQQHHHHGGDEIDYTKYPPVLVHNHQNSRPPAWEDKDDDKFEQRPTGPYWQHGGDTSPSSGQYIPDDWDDDDGGSPNYPSRPQGWPVGGGNAEYSSQQQPPLWQQGGGQSQYGPRPPFGRPQGPYPVWGDRDDDDDLAPEIYVHEYYIPPRPHHHKPPHSHYPQPVPNYPQYPHRYPGYPQRPSYPPWAPYGQYPHGHYPPAGPPNWRPEGGPPFIQPRPQIKSKPAKKKV